MRRDPVMRRASIARHCAATCRSVDPYPEHVNAPATGHPASSRSFSARYPSHAAGTRIAANGWYWGSTGAVRSHDLVRWLRENVYESEDGSSVSDALMIRPWDRLFDCFDDETLVMNTINRDEEDEPIPGVQLRAARSGAFLRAVLGPHDAPCRLRRCQTAARVPMGTVRLTIVRLLR
jgi:hypothetical protein